MSLITIWDVVICMKADEVSQTLAYLLVSAVLTVIMNICLCSHAVVVDWAWKAHFLGKPEKAKTPK